MTNYELILEKIKKIRAMNAEKRAAQQNGQEKFKAMIEEIKARMAEQQE